MLVITSLCLSLSACFKTSSSSTAAGSYHFDPAAGQLGAASYQQPLDTRRYSNQHITQSSYLFSGTR